MADYVIGGLLVVAVILAARSYFGRKYSGCCSGCSGCSHAGHCTEQRKD